MENIFLSDSFWSSVKRKQIQEILAVVFEEAGHAQAAEIARNTSRMTELAMTKMRNALAEQHPVEEIDESDLVEDSDKAIDPTELDYADEDANRLTVGDIKALIKTGKKKNIKAAKKAFKEQFAKGHPQHKELKKLFKKDV
jgi:hypothetical protein